MEFLSDISILKEEKPVQNCDESYIMQVFNATSTRSQKIKYS